MSNEGGAAFQSGQRVMSLSKKKERGPVIGTVKYVGCVEGYEGLWIGVDWDDPDAGIGRHDGSVNGVRYFDAAGEKSASFVRPQALTAGRTLLEALFARYRGEATDGEGDHDESDDMYLLSVGQRRVAVELVGKEKIERKLKRLEELTVASLVYEGISSAGKLVNVLPNLKQLDLTGNLLPDWHAVSCICDQLAALKILDLSRNRFQPNFDSLPVFAHLQVLVLNYCALDWKQTEALKHYFPVLEELHLCGNNIKLLEIEGGDFVSNFKCLRLLNLEDNCIEEWGELVKLSRLENLEQLQVGGNKLKHICYPDTVGDSVRPFASLRSLLLGGNKLEDWASVDALNLFPSLQEVRLSDNPLTDLRAGGAQRYLLVARLAKMTVLNGSEIKAKERRDSEIRYVHHVMHTMPSSTLEERTQVHPRFLELKELYDLDEEQAQSRRLTGSEKMASSLRVITLVCVAPSVGEKLPSVKKLPLSTTIGKLKLVCESLFKVKASKQQLFLREQDSPVPIPLEDDLQTFQDIGLAAETTILVDEISS